MAMQDLQVLQVGLPTFDFPKLQDRQKRFPSVCLVLATGNAPKIHHKDHGDCQLYLRRVELPPNGGNSDITT